MPKGKEVSRTVNTESGRASGRKEEEKPHRKPKAKNVKQRNQWGTWAAKSQKIKSENHAYNKTENVRIISISAESASEAAGGKVGPLPAWHPLRRLPASIARGPLPGEDLAHSVKRYGTLNT